MLTKKIPPTLLTAVWAVAVLTVGLFVLAACGGSSSAPAAAPAAATEAPAATTATEPTAAEATATEGTGAAPAATGEVTGTTPVTSTGATTSTAAATDPEAASDTASDTVAATARTFAIDPAASQATFILHEQLMGQPTEVKGVTSQVSGTLDVDPANPANTKVGVITISAADLQTDRDMRNRAIRRFILETDKYPEITFTPTAITGLPAQAKAGDSFSFQIAGDLKIKDTVKPVTFDVNLTVASDSKVEGVAKAQVKRSDFNLQIPSVPSVADVTDEVALELAFAATAQ